MAFQGDSIYWVEVEKVVPNPFQPRREFDQAKLQELGESIRMYGVLQPLTVTRKEVQREDGTFYTEYELIAGERRLRASRLAGVAQVPVIIREGEQSEQEKLELAIIENLQREDLNAVDRAIAFKQLSEQFKMSHASVAKKMGRSREYVSNSIRLLGLPEHMLVSLRLKDMMEGHARTLLMLTDRPEEQEVVYKEILLKKLSVREVERIVRKIATDKVRKKSPGEFDTGLIEMEKKFTETLGTRVQILKTDFGGKLTIDYFSEEDLEGILKRIKDEAVDQSLDKQVASERLSERTPLSVTPVAVAGSNPALVESVTEVESESFVPTPVTEYPVAKSSEIRGVETMRSAGDYPTIPAVDNSNLPQPQQPVSEVLTDKVPDHFPISAPVANLVVPIPEKVPVAPEVVVEPVVPAVIPEKPEIPQSVTPAILPTVDYSQVQSVIDPVPKKTDFATVVESGVTKIANVFTAPTVEVSAEKLEVPIPPISQIPVAEPIRKVPDFNSAPAPVVPVKVVEASTTPEAAKSNSSDDDSSMYSINNFTV